MPGDEPQKTPKTSTLRPSEFFKNLTKKREEENKEKEKHTMTVQAEVHRDTPRRLTTDRKQKQPTQMLVRQGRFFINVENIDVNVEVLSPNAKKLLTTKIVKDVAEQFMAWNVHPVAPRAGVQTLPRPQRASALPVPRAQPQMAQPSIVHQVVCPVAPRACVQAPPRPPWASALPVPRPQSSDADTRHVSSAVCEMRFRANQLGNRHRHLPFEVDEYMKEMVSKAKQLKKD